jgi:hypothetical protein
MALSAVASSLPASRSSTGVTHPASSSRTLVHTTGNRAISRRARVLRCSVPNCEHEGLFTRQYELDRHVLTKHNDYKPFHCGAINCFNRTLPWRFARADKLADHIRAKHHREVLFSDCPAESCDIGPRTLEALAIHICLAHPTLLGEPRAIVSVALGQKRKCPWWRCAKHIPCDEFLAHLSDHQPDEIVAAQDSIHFEGLALTDSTAAVDATIAQQHQVPVVQVVCPVCKTANVNFEQFVHHLWARHLFVDPRVARYIETTCAPHKPHEFCRFTPLDRTDSRLEPQYYKAVQMPQMSFLLECLLGQLRQGSSLDPAATSGGCCCRIISCSLANLETLPGLCYSPCFSRSCLINEADLGEYYWTFIGVSTFGSYSTQIRFQFSCGFYPLMRVVL